MEEYREEFKQVFGPYDRVDTNPDNPYIFWGKDDGEGNTAWYDEDGNLDSITETPDEFDPNQRKLEEDERYRTKIYRR